ncbi:hypothetical protein BH10PSE12_BH10PSE12_08100 [soil metagenome]
MHIFIDESGSFGGVGQVGPAVSAVGALILDDASMPKLFRRYERLRVNLPKNKAGEVKGSKLDEKQVAAIVDLLRRNGAIFRPALIDMADDATDDIVGHRAKRIESLGSNLTEEHRPELRAAVAALQARMAAFPDPLYVQMVLTIDMLRHVLEEMVSYHAQRNPKALAAFHWVVDAKQPSHVTDWEDWWSKTIVIWLQAISLAKRGTFFAEGDYRYFERFRFHELPPYVAKEAHRLGIKSTQGVNLGMMFTESFRFSSGIEPGLELVDIVTNALRRAMIGNLGISGWLPLRTLMVHRPDLYVWPCSLLAQDKKLDRPYKRTLNHFREGGRNMLAPRFK